MTVREMAEASVAGAHAPAFVEQSRPLRRMGGSPSSVAGAHAPALVNREFSADGPDRLWVADITYVPTARPGGCISRSWWTSGAVGSWAR